MDSWFAYKERIDARGGSRRNASLVRETEYMKRKLGDNLSSFKVEIDGKPQQVSIINTDNLDTKKIFSMPGEDLHHGGLVSWMDNHWLITEKDYNNEVYTRCTMQQCNYLLRWVDPVTLKIMERWCIVEDGTKLLFKLVSA